MSVSTDNIAARSVFVGNIPYEATEEKLKDIFSEAGPVVSFKLVYDRETGKPKGYGFCEYKDTETALSAMRNLNGYEIGGRSLRVDNACTEKSRLEMQNLLAGPPVDNTYGDPVEPDKAPEVISKAVASLPPEQMFELMRQMKICIQNNPTEGRQMLLQNPQLAYALLQAQVVMKIVDPQIALSMLHKSQSSIAPIMPDSNAPPQPVPPVVNNNINNDKPSLPAKIVPPPIVIQQPQPIPPPVPTSVQSMQPLLPSPVMQPPRVAPLQPPQFPPNMPGQDIDLRSIDPRLNRPNSIDQDFRLLQPPSMVPPVQQMIEQTPTQSQPVMPRDPRFNRDPRTARLANAIQPPKPIQPPTSIPAAGGAASDQEKAALIMQVLQLSDEQIAMLPPEQRQSILVLKEQIAKSAR